MVNWPSGRTGGDRGFLRLRARRRELVFAYEKISPWSALVLFLVPALAAQRLFTLYQREARLG